MDLARLTEAYPSAQLLCTLLLAILFLQSGIDKIIDRRGNRSWLKGHFAKSPLSGMVPFLLTVITFTEVAAGTLAAAGAVMLVMFADTRFALIGAQLGALNLLMLFVGQRLAKDYEGAATLVSYFLLSIFTIFLLA